MRRAHHAIAAALAAFVVLVAHVDFAHAHASLLSSEPRDGVMLPSAPPRLSLTFNEPVAPLVMRLISPDGAITPLAAAAVDRTLNVTLPQLTTLGSYLLSWRVISADGHPVGGSMLFSIGRLSPVTPTTVALETGTPVRIGIWIARVIIYCGLFIGLGGAFFASWFSFALPSRLKSVLTTLLGVSIVAVAISVGLQGLDALAAPLQALLHPVVFTAGFRTSYGTTAVVAACGLILGLAALHTSRPLGARATSLAALTLAALALSLSGHASVASPQLLMRPAVFLHAAMIAIWAGSLLPLLALLRKPRARLAPLALFSRVAPLIVLLLAVTGIVLVCVQLGTFSALWKTSYGIVLSCKGAALVALAALAAVNRYRFTPALSKPAARAGLRRSVAAEIAIALVVFGLAALWRFTPPPRSLARGEPAFVHLHGDGAMADITAVPGRAGPVAIEVRLSREDFAPLAAREVEIGLSQPNSAIEQLVRHATVQPDGLWAASGFALPVAGVWTVTVDVLVDDFDRRRLDGPIVIGPAAQ